MSRGHTPQHHTYDNDATEKEKLYLKKYSLNTHDFNNKTCYSRLPIICVKVIKLVDYFSICFIYIDTDTHEV